MTSAARIRSKDPARVARSSGMTLLETVIALSLVAVLLGLGVVYYVADSGERELREAVVKVEALASRGHAMSILHQKPFWLRIEPGRVVLAGADLEGGFRNGDDEFVDPALAWEEESASSEVVYDTFETDVRIGMRRWGAKPDDWFFPKETATGITWATWNFQSTGLCEPVSFRAERDENWVEIRMHPLTARIDEEAMEIR